MILKHNKGELEYDYETIPCIGSCLHDYINGEWFKYKSTKFYWFNGFMVAFEYLIDNLKYYAVIKK